MRRLRFEAVQPGYVFEHKEERYVKFAGPINVTPRLGFNAVDSRGHVIFFLPYEEVSSIGPLLKEKL